MTDVFLPHLIIKTYNFLSQVEIFTFARAIGVYFNIACPEHLVDYVYPARASPLGHIVGQHEH